MFGPNEDRITRPTRGDFRSQVPGGLALLAPRGANLFVRKFAFPAISALLSLLYVARTGIPRRDLPREFGKWDTIDNRYRHWLSIAIDSWNRTAACDLQPVSSLAQKRYNAEAV